MYRLLIADDEESIREGVADFVRQNCPEWDVAALARDGREALALAREILPDAVLTDITMPHMNGLEFLESLSDLLPEAKLLVLSGYDQFELRKRPPSWSFPTANLRRLAPMRSRNRRRPLPPTRMFWPESFCRVRSRRRSSFVTSPPRYSAAAGLLLSKIAKRCSHGLWSGRSAMRHSFACACCAYAIPF